MCDRVWQREIVSTGHCCVTDRPYFHLIPPWYHLNASFLHHFFIKLVYHIVIITISVFICQNFEINKIYGKLSKYESFQSTKVSKYHQNINSSWKIYQHGNIIILLHCWRRNVSTSSYNIHLWLRWNHIKASRRSISIVVGDNGSWVTKYLGQN